MQAMVRGLGQVVFLPGRLSGALVLVGLAWASGWVALAAAGGALGGAVTARALRRPATEIAAGLWGFNGALVALAVPIRGPGSALAALLGAAATVPVGMGLGAAARRVGLAAYTLPFIGVTWAVWWVVPPGLGGAGAGDVWSAGVLGLAQVFLVEQVATGWWVVAALAAGGWRRAVLGMWGALVGVAVGLAWGEEAAAMRGLFSFSGALTALAVGGVGRGVWATVGAALASASTPVVAGVLARVGLPALTLPFVLATWAVQLGLRGWTGWRVRSKMRAGR